jgi:hypothetical protein
MRNEPIDDASRYLSRLAIEIKTPQQRLRNLKVLLKLTSDPARGRVSYVVAKFVSDRIDALDTKAEQQGVEDPMALTFDEASCGTEMVIEKHGLPHGQS